MKSKNEIEQLAFLEFPRLVNDPYNPMEDDNAYERQIWIDAYTKCQEDIKKELYQFGKLVLDTFHSEGKTNSGHERLARQKFDEWFNQHQEDMVVIERREIQPEDIWNKENQDKIKEYILIHAGGQSPEDKLETELAAKKYTEEDMVDKKYTKEDIAKAWEAGMRFVGEDKGSYGEFIQSLNKQD